MEAYSATMLEVITIERSLVLLLSITDPDVSKKANVQDHDRNIIMKLLLKKLHKQ